MNKKSLSGQQPIPQSEASGGHSRREFFQRAGLLAGAAAALGLPQSAGAADTRDKSIFGLEAVPDEADAHDGWVSASDRKLRVGLIGHGLCGMAASFGFEQHPNVEVVAVSDLIPERCDALAKYVKCDKKYPSGEEMIKDVKRNKLDAVCVATDPPSHVPLSVLALEHGLHVACCVPAVWGIIEDADKLMHAVKRSGLKYMMMETSAFYKGNHTMRMLYQGGALGEPVYTEGEYWHYASSPLPSYNGWRNGGPPMWYPTHSNAYHICVTGGSFTEVSCMGWRSKSKMWDGKNQYKNPFGSQTAMFRTSEGGMARMAVGWDAPGMDENVGRIRGTKGAYTGRFEGANYFEKYDGLVEKKNLPNCKRPPLPPGVHAGGHDGAEGYLMDEFITSILKDRKPLVDVGMALNLTVSGLIAYKSALKDGELLKIPQYKL